MIRLKERVKFYPSLFHLKDEKVELLKILPNAITKLFIVIDNVEPIEKYEFENMHDYFTYTNPNLTMEMFIGASCIPTMFRIQYKEKEFQEICCFNVDRLETGMSGLCAKIKKYDKDMIYQTFKS